MSRGLSTGIAEVRDAPGGGLKSLAACVASAAAVAALLAFPILSCAAQGERTAEYRSKANFLTAFPSFVDWPGTAFASAQAPFLICVRGDFSFGTALAEAARSATPHGRRIEVRWTHKEQELLDCQVLFVSRSESRNYAKLLRLVEGRAVLTVGETPDFLAAGGIISFALDQDTLQFEVNLVAADSEGLKISSRLLTLARRVLSRTEAAKN